MKTESQILYEIGRINDENRLFEIYENSDSFEIRYAIVNLIYDDSILYKIFSNEKMPLSKPLP